jgi:asparagine synthase (glutamine-hydrolysing)
MNKPKLGVLFSGGKDSMYAAWLEKERGNEIVCLITMRSDNPDSFMFHTPAIELTDRQAMLMELPLLAFRTRGEKERELWDLERAINDAKERFGIDGVITGALASNYQFERIGKICERMGLICVNPLWKKNQIELLQELLKEKFEVIVSGVFAYPLTKEWVGRKIDAGFIKEMEKLQEKYKINPAGEGGEIETLVVNCPLFRKKLNVKLKKVVGEKHSWRGEFG